MAIATPLRLGPDLVVPGIEAQTGTELVLGGKGMGKTNFATVYVEELAEHRLRFCWLDPVGVAWGLKHSADGRGPGLPVLILGGRHGDLPILPTAGAVVADLVVDEDVSVVIDIASDANGRMWKQGEKIRFVRDFCIRLFERQGEDRRPIKLVIDEAGRFIPQDMPKGAVDIAECVGAIEQLVELGRNVGVGVMLLTQRSARIRKSVAELAEMLAAFRTVGPRSIDAIIDWFGEHILKEKQRSLVERLRMLTRGTALIVSPGWLQIEGEFAIRARRTFDTSATPVAGQERRPRGKGAQAPDLDRYQQRMAETVEEANANDPKVLRARVAELERQLATRPAAEPVEVVRTVVPDDLKEFMVETVEQVRGAATDMRDRAQSMLDRANEVAADLATRLGRVDSVPVARPAPPRQPTSSPARPVQAPATSNGTDGIADGARKILVTVARNHPVRLTERQVATLAGYSVKSSQWKMHVGSLKRAGLIEVVGSEFHLTLLGMAETGEVERLPATHADMVAMWRDRLQPGPVKLLDAVLDAHPRRLSYDELAEVTGYSVTSSQFKVHVSTLRRNGLADVVDGAVGVDPSLFPNERQHA